MRTALDTGLQKVTVLCCSLGVSVLEAPSAPYTWGGDVLAGEGSAVVALLLLLAAQSFLSQWCLHGGWEHQESTVLTLIHLGEFWGPELNSCSVGSIRLCHVLE